MPASFSKYFFASIVSLLSLSTLHSMQLGMSHPVQISSIIAYKAGLFDSNLAVIMPDQSSTDITYSHFHCYEQLGEAYFDALEEYYNMLNMTQAFMYYRKLDTENESRDSRD